jgi:hypothetical protein
MAARYWVYQIERYQGFICDGFLLVGKNIDFFVYGGQ